MEVKNLGHCVEIKITCCLKKIKTKKVSECDVDEERDEEKFTFDCVLL